MPRRVLIVDDEPQIRAVLLAYLQAAGFEATQAATGAEALRQVRTPELAPDLILLDLGLPDLDGLEVLRTIRTTSQVFVILVTARTEEVDKVVGLGVGADDYITKPFSAREVVARVQAVLRRARADALDGPSPEEPADVLRFQGLTIDLPRRQIEREGMPVTLSALEFDLLVALAQAPGRVYSRSQLLEKVWGYDFFGDERVVDVHIRSMRKSLGDDASAPAILGTVRGVGYKFLLHPLDDTHQRGPVAG